MLRRCVATCSWVFEDSKVSGRVLVLPVRLAMGSIHRFFVWLDAPRDSMPFFDFNPAHNVGLFTSAFLLVCISILRTLLWISNCSKPAIVLKYHRLLRFQVSPFKSPGMRVRCPGFGTGKVVLRRFAESKQERRDTKRVRSSKALRPQVNIQYEVECLFGLC